MDDFTHKTAIGLTVYFTHRYAPPPKQHGKTRTVDHALDLALAAAAFGHDVMLIFQGNGLNLLADQTLQTDQFRRVLQQLDVFDLAPLYLCKSSMEQATTPIKHLHSLPISVIEKADILKALQPPRHCLVF
jgi:sulfur relay (sulfurtransferase) DsrF/TusC family protein